MSDLKHGQVWRVRKTGTLRRITGLTNHSRPTSEPYYDVSWETVGTKPTRRGATYQEYFLKNCEFVRDAR